MHGWGSDEEEDRDADTAYQKANQRLLRQAGIKNEDGSKGAAAASSRANDEPMERAERVPSEERHNSDMSLEHS